MAAIVGAFVRKDFIAAREQPHLGRALGLCGIERMHEGVDAVVAGKRGQPEVGDDEPLGRKGIDVILGRAGDLRHHDVDPRRQRANGVSNGKGGGDIGVERLLNRHLAFPHLGAALFGEAVEVVAVEIALEIAPHHRLEQIAVADAVDFERHRRGIDAHHRNATLPGPRQHVSLAGEARLRLAIAHIDVEVRGFRQRLPHLRGNAGAQRDGVTIPVLEALDAELPLLHRECGLVLAADGDEGREVGALARQVLGELEADARRGGIRIDRVVEQPEAVLLTQALVLLPHLGDLAQLERNAQRIEGRTPELAIGIGARDHD